MTISREKAGEWACQTIQNLGHVGSALLLPAEREWLEVARAISTFGLRTPGTVEVCSFCRMTKAEMDDGICFGTQFSDMNKDECPLAAPPHQKGSDEG